MTTTNPAELLDLLRSERSTVTRIDAGVELLAWLQAGGYVPCGLFPPGRSFGGHTAARLAAVTIIDREVEAVCDLQDELDVISHRDPSPLPSPWSI